MTDFNYWNPYFADNKYPCFVHDIQSGEIIYANQEFFKAFNCDNSIVGKKYLDVIQVDNASYDYIKESIFQKNDYEFSFFHENSQQNCQGISHLIRDNRSVFCQCRVLVEEDSNLEKALSRCMEIYRLPSDQVVSSLMELLCDYYHAGRAYVHRVDYTNNQINCIEQFARDKKYLVNTKIFDKKNATMFLDWVAKENNDGLICADFMDINFPNPPIKELFQSISIKNMKIRCIEDLDKKIIGIVGISNIEPFDITADCRLLTTIARFVAQDVTKDVVDAQLNQLHHRDSLTGMYNRVGYAKQVDILLGMKPKTMGVISANVNGLKFINENSGIAGGDEHIKKSAERLNNFFGFDFFRMSGDEFLGIAPDFEKDAFESLVAQLHSTMKKEDNYDFSFGHAWTSGAFNLPKLIFEAETVMYINKQEYYSNSERKFDSVSDTVLSDLLSFLENEEFMVYLQPQVRLKDGSLHGAEALIRRFDKTNQKMVFPDQFIPLYEQKSVIRHVDMFVVEKVCSLLQEWEKLGKAIPISVNLSRVTLLEYGIVSTIVKICDNYQVPHHLLVIEVTERVGLIENNVASNLIQQFTDNGFHISLDDFGCAYSNIVTLAQIRVDEVKIDKSLVDHLTTNQNNHILVKNVLTMCNELEGATTLAEGIEEEEQAKLLYNLGCHLGQGYFYSRPIPVDEFYGKYIGTETLVD